jgi:uncharacterized protein (TIGR02145 family)
MDKFQRYELELLLAAAVLAPAAAGLFWLYWLGKTPKPEPAFETRSTPSVISDRFTDQRDGRNYRTVLFGNGKTWMAQNINYQTDNSRCYNDSDSYCEKYGRLYDWEAANTACPDGWHLPSRAEWDSLADYAGDAKQVSWISGYANKYYWWPNAGTRLKSADGWYNSDAGNVGNGTNDYGFSALPGGYLSNPNGSFHFVGHRGFWWTATEHGTSGCEYESGCAYGMYMHDNDVNESRDSKSTGRSVRCVQDTWLHKEALP